MKNLYYAIFAALSIRMLAGCGILGKKSSRSAILPNDGQFMVLLQARRYILPKPPGMVYIPQGTFHMGPSDEDPAYAFSARNRTCFH